MGKEVKKPYEAGTHGSFEQSQPHEHIPWILPHVFPIFSRRKAALVSRQRLSSVVIITGVVTYVTPDKVHLHCLLDKTNRILQERVFDREPFEGAITLEPGIFVEIRIITQPGERKFEYKQINGDGIKHLFEPENMFEEFADSPIFNPMPSVNEDQL